VLAKFPGAEILEVRQMATPAPSTPDATDAIDDQED